MHQLPVSLMGFNPSLVTISLAIRSLAASVGWYSSQNTYLLLSSHRVDNGVQVSVGRIRPTEQHGASELLKPAPSCMQYEN